MLYLTYENFSKGNDMSEIKFMECQCCGNRDTKSFKPYERGYICGCCGVAFYREDDKKLSNDEKNRTASGYANLRNYEFQKARYAFTDVLRDYPKSIDARWGLLLAKYGVVFIKGFFDGVVEPIYCFPEYDELGNKTFRGEPEYGEILELTENDDELTDFYEKKSRKIDTAIRKFRECKNEIERDVFICVKISAATERNPEAQGRTEDYAFAQKVYNDLRAKGLNVFFSFVTLHNEVQSDHEIWLNLVKSKKMLLIGSREEYIESSWVKSEWKRWFFLERHDEMYICSMRHDYENPKSILPHELRTTQIYTLDTYDKLIADISGETAAAEERAKLEAEERARKAEELRKQAELEDRLRWEEEMKAQFQAQLKAQAEKMEKMKSEMVAKAEAEARLKAKAEAENKAIVPRKQDGKIVYKDGHEEVLKYGITEIEKELYKNNEDIVSIVLPNSVTSIGNSAFSHCKNLMSIVLPNSVTSIGEWAFHCCFDLKNIYYAGMKEQWEKISGSSLTFDFGTKVHFAGKVVCKDGRTEVLEYGITEIRMDTLLKCSLIFDVASVVSIVLPNSVTSIGNCAFSWYKNLESITIPNSVTTIGRAAFSGCRALTSIEIPNSVTSIGNSAFRKCERLERITIPNSVINIGDLAFSECCALTRIEIPNGVTTIGKCVFSGCANLCNIEIPNSVTSIGEGIFFDCNRLENIYYGGTTDEWRKTSGISLNDELENAKVYFAGKIVYKYGREEVLKYGITDIKEKAYYDNKNIVSILLPDSIISIGENAFYKCSRLKSVTIPYSVTSIGKWAFYRCIDLEDIYYTGSQSDWNRIEIEKNGNEKLNGNLFQRAKIHYNCK